MPRGFVHRTVPVCVPIPQVAYAAAKVQLRSSNCNEAEVPLTDGENKVQKKDGKRL